MLRLDRGIRKIGGSGKEITRSSRVMTERGAGNDKGENASEENDDGTYSFAFLTNTLNNTFQSSMNEKFQELCDEAGYEYTCFDPDYDLNTQLSQLSDAANQGFDAVFVFAVALFAYAAPAAVGGNGYLSTYIVGIILGNSKIANKKYSK